MPEEKKRQPTVIPLEGVRKKEQRLAPQSSPKARGPTMIPGVERRRIPVTTSDLRTLSPQTTQGVLERALHLLEVVVVEKLTDRKVILWGYELQQDYSNLVSETLILSQDTTLVKASDYLSRMLEILEAINLVEIYSAGSGMITQYLRKGNAKIDTPAELESARNELDQLVRLMADVLGPLLDLKEKLESHSRRIEEIGLEVEASSLGALFLSSHLQSSKPNLAQRFTERSMSLTATLAQIRGTSPITEIQVEQPLRLISAIQNVALVTLPGWIGSLASLTVLASNRKPTKTEAGELSYQLQQILTQLKGK